MSIVNIQLFRSVTHRPNARTSVPPVLDGENQQPLNPEGGGGSVPDPNKVSYNQADNKNARERAQARENIGSTSMPPQIVATAGAIDNLAITSNNIVFTGHNVVISGIVAGLDGEEVTILNTNATALSILSQSGLSNVSNRIIGSLMVPQNSVVRLKYRATTNRWIIEALSAFDSRYVRKDVADSRVGNLTQNGQLSVNGNFFIDAQVGGSGFLSNGPWFRISNLNVDIVLGRRGIFTSGGFSANNQNTLEFMTPWFSRARTMWFINSGNAIEVRREDDNTVLFTVNSNGRVVHARSGAFNESLRRDELHLNYSQTIVTTGTINNLAINADCKLLILTGADDLTGIVGEQGRLLRIEARGKNITIVRDSLAVNSIATNRFNLGFSDNLVIPSGFFATFLYSNFRWQLLDKNFDDYRSFTIDLAQGGTSSSFSSNIDWIKCNSLATPPNRGALISLGFGREGRRLLISNSSVNEGEITIRHETGVIENNRFDLGGTDLIMSFGESYNFVYWNNRWRLIK